jgi:hypothetical protein
LYVFALARLQLRTLDYGLIVEEYLRGGLNRDFFVYPDVQAEFE